MGENNTDIDMLLIKTKIQQSSIHGIGLFADQFIPKGTAIWRYTPGFDQRFTREQILGFPDLIQAYLYRYSWKSAKSGLYCFSSDNGKYFNHSEDPNVLSSYVDGEEEVLTIAIRDIQAGEEITDNYNSFEDVSEEGNALEEIRKRLSLDEEADPRRSH